MAPRTAVHECAVSPEEYWALRNDASFEKYCCAADGCSHEMLSLTETDGIMVRICSRRGSP